METYKYVEDIEENKFINEYVERMSKLRDKFAAAALTGLLSGVGGTPANVARSAYEFADAMMDLKIDNEKQKLQMEQEINK